MLYHLFLFFRPVGEFVASNRESVRDAVKRHLSMMSNGELRAIRASALELVKAAELELQLRDGAGLEVEPEYIADVVRSFTREVSEVLKRVNDRH